MKRRLLSIILIILVALSFASCGIEVKKAGSSDNHQESGIDDIGGNNKGKAQRNNTDETTGDMDELAIAGDMDESELPEGFRTDLVPIFKGSVILDVLEDAEMPDFLVYSLTCYSDKPFAAVQAFYKEIMSNHQVQDEQVDKGFYFVTGNINDTDTIDIYVQDLSEMGGSEFPKDAKTMFELMYKQPKKGEIPEGFRADLVPVMDGSKLKQNRVFDDKGVKVYSLTFDTIDELEDVIEFYREIMMDAESMQESEHPDGCNIEGTIDNVKISIFISRMHAGEFKTAYTIQMEI